MQPAVSACQVALFISGAINLGCFGQRLNLLSPGVWKHKVTVTTAFPFLLVQTGTSVFVVNDKTS